jgi:structural maintenance of chromosome 1
MDAISFVFGVDSKHLRSQSLKDMIYRSPNDSERGPSTASVTAVYRKNNGQEIKFTRLVKRNLSSEYRIDNKAVPFSKYTNVLEKEHILIMAKNFLVFQGDIESIASQDAAELTKLIERVCGSHELKDDYDDLKREMDEAIDVSGQILNRKRDIASEIKHYQAQKEEAERFEKTVEEKHVLTVKYLLWKLYHIDDNIAQLEKDKDERFFQQSDAKRDEVKCLYLSKRKCLLIASFISFLWNPSLKRPEKPKHASIAKRQNSSYKSVKSEEIWKI